MAQGSKFAEKLLAETTGTSVTLFSKEDGKCQIRRLTAGEGGVAPKGGGEANGMERTCEGALTLVAKTKTTLKYILLFQLVGKQYHFIDEKSGTSNCIKLR